MKTIPNSLKMFREAKGLTQLQVAQHLGFVSTDHMSKRETGKMYPPLSSSLAAGRKRGNAVCEPEVAVKASLNADP